MDRTERLLDLVALLLDAKEPTSWAQLREAFPSDYGQGSDEACERKFERDKAELLELGIPIRYSQGDDDQPDGYIVERDAYYLPEVGLTPEELAVLYAAGSAALASGAFPGRQDLAHALRKIGFSAGAEVPRHKVRLELGAAGSGDLAQKLEQLWEAASARKWVAISYYSPGRKTQTERKVDPYGLALRRGIWSLVGYCHLRQDIRTFHVQRIRSLQVNTAKPRSADFQVPADFQLERYVANHPWEYRFHEPVEVELALSGEEARIATGLFPSASPERDEQGRVRVKLSARYLDGLMRYALSLAPSCVVLSPPEAVARHRAMLERVLERHAPAPAVCACRAGEERGMSGDVHERLRRLLFLVPYVAKHPGITVDALAEAAGATRENLLKELDLLAFVGRPPFQPDDYIDIYVENDKVYVDLDQRLSAPPRLTAAEAAALSAAAELLRPAAGDALSSARAKLERALPPGSVERFREMNRRIDAHAVAPEGLGPLTQAIGQHLEVEFDYFSAGRGASEHRTVRPRELFAHRGQWYLSAWCCTRQDDRLFRLDRVQNVVLSDRAFTPVAGQGRTLPNPIGAQGSVRVGFSPMAAPYVRERFGSEARSTAEGGVEVQVAAGPEAERWLTTWVLSFGGEAWISEPEWARSAVARAASGSLKSGVTR